MEIYGIKEVDMTSGTVTFVATFRMWWNDSRLTWDPADYGNVNQIFLKSDPGITPRAWIPDIVVREDAGSGTLSDLKYKDVKVYSTGLCYISRLGDLKVSVSFDMTKFPYDE